jgi:excinuclease ABC subunit C
LEAYDISHTGAEDSVGAMVVFRGNRPERGSYRRFKIRGEASGDDYGSIQEILYRRIKRGMEQSPGFENMPDLILIDGGLGHVHAAEEVLRAMKVDIRVAGMVKDNRHRTRGLVYRDEELDLKEHPKLFALIGGIQEEVHRFAITYHRGVRNRKAIRSELEEIAGIGEKRRNALLLAFGSIDGIREAGEAELAAVPGMNRASAHAVSVHFHR